MQGRAGMLVAGRYMLVEAVGQGGTLAVADRTDADVNRKTYLWNPATKTLITTLPDPGGTGVETLAFGPDSTLAVGDFIGHTCVWRISVGRS